jgi:diacylglycerol kinase (ATP)
MPSGMRVALVFNPRSGRGRPKGEQLADVVEAMGRLGMRVEPHATERPRHATELARSAVDAGYELVVAWGGDGTLNEVASGLVGSAVRFGVLPGGTVNVFARETGIPLKLEPAIDNLASGRARSIPVGTANERIFLLMAGLGIDGEVVYRLKSGLKDALGALAFWLDGFKMLAHYPMLPLRVHYEGKVITGTGVVAGKLARYGPRYFVTPDAELEEPKLDVVVFQGTNRRDYLRYLFGVLARAHVRFPDVAHFKTNALRVGLTCPEDRVRMQLDGEPAGYAPVELGVRENAVSVVLPDTGRRNR